MTNVKPLRLGMLAVSLICSSARIEQASCSQAAELQFINIEVPIAESVVLHSSDTEVFDLTPVLKPVGFSSAGGQLSSQSSKDLSFTVSSEMLTAVKEFCVQLEVFLKAEVSSESGNPFAVYKPEVITSTLRRDVQNWKKKTANRISTNREKLFTACALVKSETSLLNMVESLILIGPPLSVQVGLPENKRALSARIFKRDGNFFDTRVWRCDVYGSPAFITRCLDTTYFGKVMGRSNYLSYLREVLGSEKEVCDKRFEQIAADINLLTRQAVEEKLSEQSLLKQLKSRVDGEAAYNAASKISKRTGPKIIAAATALLQGSSDPVRDASLYKHSLHAMRNAFNPEGAQWLIDYFRDSGTLVVTTNQLWIVETNVALVLAENISDTFGLVKFADLKQRDSEINRIKEKLITQGGTGLDQNILSQILSAVNAIDLGDWEPWAVKQRLLSERPIEPRYPRPLWNGMTRDEAVGTFERAAERALNALEIDDYERYKRSIRETNNIFDNLLRQLLPAYNAAMTRYKDALNIWLSKRAEVENQLTEAMQKKKQEINNNLMFILSVDERLEEMSGSYHPSVNFFITSLMFWLP